MTRTPSASQECPSISDHWHKFLRSAANKAHVYVITTGDAAGTIPIKSAEQDGDLIELSFDADLCGSKSSLMFALPSNFPPTQGRGAILQFGKTPLSPTKVFAPKHPGAQTTPSNTDDPQ